jgi:hypothetical protein
MSKKPKKIATMEVTITLRDYFASAALQGYIGSGRLELENLAPMAEETIAEICYQFSDAMIHIRARKK